jgi:hypothetical protein
MFAAIDLIPDSWQSGPLNEVIMLGAVLAAIGVILKLAVIPVFRWIRNIALAFETTVDRLDRIPQHHERIDHIEERLGAIQEALRPTNGDRRSISDRLDTVKQQTMENSNEVKDLKIRMNDLLGGKNEPN